MELEEFIDIALNQYIEQDIIRLDVSDTTKNRLKRDLRKIFKDEDLIHDIKEESISRAVVEEKIEEIDYSYKNIEKNYTEEQLDNYDVSEEDYIEMEKREFAEMILQEILNKGE